MPIKFKFGAHGDTRTLRPMYVRKKGSKIRTKLRTKYRKPKLPKLTSLGRIR